MSKGEGQKIAIKFDKPLTNPDASTGVDEEYSIGKVYKASHEPSGYEASKAFDKNSTTLWRPGYRLTNAWISVDLGEPQFVGRIVSRSSSTDYYTSWRLEYSDDDINWSTAVQGGHTGGNQLRTHDFRVIKARYWRVYVLARVGNYPGFYEIEIWGRRDTINAYAFYATGMQLNPLVIGEPELRTFTPYAIECYPVAILYEGDFSGTSDGVEFGGNGIKLPNSKIVEDFENETYSLNITGTWQRSSRAFYQGGFSFESDNKTHGSDASSYITFTTLTAQKVSLWYRVSSEYKYDKLYIYLNDEVKVDGISSAGDWQFAEWDTVAGENIIHVRYTKDGSSSSNLDAGFIDLITIGVDEYSTPGSYIITTPTDTLPTNSYIKWAENLPAGTSITAEYAVNQDGLSTPTTWTPISNSDLLTIPDTAGHFLWLKYTLATTDTSVTPTLLSVWLGSPDTILLLFDTYNRFNDVEGDITVVYNQSLGALKGIRPVESFSVSFLPTDLVGSSINPHSVGIGVSDVFVNLTEIYYTHTYNDHSVSIGVSDVSVNLINIEDINP